MESPLLLSLLEREKNSFQQIDNKWRPQNLFYEIQTQELLKDMILRWKSISNATVELQALERADFYSKLVRRMELVVRRAGFVRRSNHLAFAEAVSDFYGAYGEALRFLKIDQGRGKLQPAAT